MVLWGKWIGTAGFIALLFAYSPANARDYQPQSEVNEIAFISDVTSPLEGYSLAHRAVPPNIALQDAGLPDAPDLEAIPFFTARDNAVYVRADAGFSVPFARDAVTANGRLNPSLSGSALFGVGLGYKLGYVLRGDVTAEYRSRAGIQTADGIRAHTIGTALLANIYADIGTWYGVTPYIGAGAGLGWSKQSVVGAFRDDNQTNFIWALTGGFSVALTPSITFDLGYRYLDTGIRRSNTITLRESGAHDIRIGLRWRLGEAEAFDLADLP